MPAPSLFSSGGGLVQSWWVIMFLKGKNAKYGVPKPRDTKKRGIQVLELSH